MNDVDFVYLILLDAIKGHSVLSNTVDLRYAYDIKYADARVKDIAYIYEVSKNNEFFGIGGKYVTEHFLVSVNFLTLSRRRLGLFEKLINDKYNALHYSFWNTGLQSIIGLEEGVDFTEVQEISGYVDKVILTDGNLYNFQRGDLVYISDSGYEYGWVWAQYGDELYVFYGEGEYVLTLVERTFNISERMKGFYEMSFDLVGRIIRKVNR